MSDNELDAELLALAGDEPSEPQSGDANKQTSPPPVPEVTDDPPSSPPEGTAVPSIEIEPARDAPPKKGVARKASKPSAKPRAKLESDEEGQASDADSLGSGAMSESDSDDSPGDSTRKGDAVSDEDLLFPVDGNFYSEKDKAEIMALPEIERERILAERAVEAEQKAQDAQLVRMLKERKEEAQAAEKKKRKAGAADLDDSPRKSNRAKVKASDNLEAYKRQREARNEQRRRDDARKSTLKGADARGRDRSSDRDADGESDVEWDDGRSRTPAKDEPQPELRDFERIRVGRSNFAKVCFYPGFDAAIAGCFCRVNIGPERETGQNVYRMTQIKEFTTGKPYAMEGPNGKTFLTDQYAVVQHGKSEKTWPFIACSDGRITEGEYERYKRAQQTDALRIPSMSYLAAKLQNVHDLLNHQWTDAEISEKIERQQRLTTGDRRRLQSERETAIKDGDEAAIARIDQKLAALESALNANSVKPNGAPKPPTEQDRLAILNRANRKANQEEIRKAQIAEKRLEIKRRAAIARGEAVADPFIRVKTRAKFYHDAETMLNPPKKEADDLFGEASDGSRAGTPATAASKSRATPATSTPRAGTPSGVKRGSTPGPGGFRKRNMDDEILSSMDLGIEIDI